MGTGLLAKPTWGVQVQPTVVSGAPITGTDGDTYVDMFPLRLLNQGGAGSVNMFSISGRVLYLMCQVFSNNDNGNFAIQLVRNGIPLPVATIFDPNETGRKALLLNIPFGANDRMQYRIIKPGNFSIVSFTLFVAGRDG